MMKIIKFTLLEKEIFMNTCLLLVLVALVLPLGNADTIKSHPDIVASAQLANAQLFKRCGQCSTRQRPTLQENINYLYKLVNSDEWTLYPDMQINFRLEFDQFVTVRYTFGIGSQNGFLVTHLFVDGVQDRDFRGHQNGLNPTIFSYGQIFLKKGYHKMEIRYRTNVGATMTNKDWQSANFKVEYHKS